MAQKSAEVSGLTRPFSFEFVDEDKSYKFQTNVAIPSDISKVNEFAKRIVIYHNLPVYLEEGKILVRCLVAGYHLVQGTFHSATIHMYLTSILNWKQLCVKVKKDMRALKGFRQCFYDKFNTSQ